MFLHHQLPLAKKEGVKFSCESKVLTAHNLSMTDTTFQLVLHFSGLNKSAVTNILIHVN